MLPKGFGRMVQILFRHVPICLAGLFATVSMARAADFDQTFHPTLVMHAATPEEFVPKDWSILQMRKGDLNNDGVADSVLIMEQSANTSNYLLAVVLANPTGGFDLAVVNDKLLSSRISDKSYANYLDLNGFRIRRGTFTLEMRQEGVGGLAAITFTFRRQDERFILIGYDYMGEHRGRLDISFNMLTGQLVATDGYEAAGRVHVVERKKIGKFVAPVPVDLATIGHGFDFNEKFNPLKYSRF